LTYSSLFATISNMVMTLENKQHPGGKKVIERFPGLVGPGRRG
jgi:hypothetical protein